jgi:hypothetical protein
LVVDGVSGIEVEGDGAEVEEFLNVQVVAALGGVGERSATPVVLGVNQAGELAVEKEQGLRGANECQYMDTGEIARVGLAVVVVSVLRGQALVPRLPGKTGGGPGHLCRNQ